VKLSTSILFSIPLLFVGCITDYARLPNSVSQVYANTEVQQALLLVAKNNVLVNIPEETTREFEKTEIDQKCRHISEPIWSEKLSVYLNEFRRHPELLTRFNVIELKRGDNADVKVQKDLDGAITLSVQFAKLETHGKVTFQTQLPCGASIAEYMGRDLVKTDYDFPDMQKFVQTVQALPEKKDIPRFQFANDFLAYLAERGTLFKFSHEMSFEKTSQGKYVMAELLNKLAAEVKEPFHRHMNYWFKQINQQSTQAKLIQLFAAIQDKELKAGVRVDLKNETTQRVAGESDLTYLYITYNVENDVVNFVNLQQLEKCLQSFTENMSGVHIRTPASADKESYLKPGYSCSVDKVNP
jgi:hypothetical protein